MTLYTLGFTQKNAETFFGLIKDNQIEILLDIRLNNKSQLAGFTKGEDLKYFLKEICNCKYVHESQYAPSKEILDDYKKKKNSWTQYVERYIPLMESRSAVDGFMKHYGEYNRVCLLCSEPTPEQCHRRLFAEMIQEAYPTVVIKHL